MSCACIGWLVGWRAQKEYMAARDDVVTAAAGPVASWVPHLMDLCIARERTDQHRRQGAPIFISSRDGCGVVWVDVAATLHTVLHNASMLTAPQRVVPEGLKAEPVEHVHHAIDAVERFVALRRVCVRLSGLDLPAFPAPPPVPRVGVHMMLRTCAPFPTAARNLRRALTEIDSFVSGWWSL